MSQYFDVSGVNLISAGGSRLYKNTVAVSLSDSSTEIIAENINSEVYPFSLNSEKTSLEIGKDASGNYINGCIKSFAYYSQGLSSEQLKALTTRKETTQIPSLEEPVLIMGVSITSPNTTWNLRSSGTVSYDIDWGDGQIEIAQTSNTKAHTYASPGIYKVVVKLLSGVFRPFYNNNADAQRIVSIFGTGTGWSFGISLLEAFRGAINLINIDDELNIINVTDFTNAWRECMSLLNFPLLNTLSVTSFNSAWNNCSSLTSFPLINTSSATNFSYTWFGCSSLTSFPPLNSSNVTVFAGAWYNCSSLTSFPLIDTSNGTNFFQTWLNCSSLTSFPLINTAAGTSFASAWFGCSSLISFPLINTAAGTSFASSWRSCSSLTSFPLIDTSNGTNFSFAWNGCSSLTSFPLINTSVATNLESAWGGCSSLTSFPLINTLNVTNFIGAWNGCSSLTSFPAINTSNGTNFNFTWNNCLGLTSFSFIDVSNGTTFQNTWNNCQITSFPSNMFNSCPATNFLNAFSGCALTAQSIENILVSIDTANTSNGTLSINGGTNASKTTWSTAANAAYDALIARGWTISFNA